MNFCIMLLFDTGMRCNEMILMEPEDIKPDYILVKHGKGQQGTCGAKVACAVQAANEVSYPTGWPVPESFPQGMQRALCSKPEEDICAACTNNAHRWILL